MEKWSAWPSISSRWISLLIPLAGIILILFVYFEGVHQLLLNLPMKKVSVQELLEYQQLLSAMLM